MKRHLLLLLPTLPSLACATLEAHLPSPRPAVIASPAGFTGFPTTTTDDRVWAEATLCLDAEDLFGTDPIAAGILPIALRIGVVIGPGSEQTELELDGRSFGPELYLQDGTALAPATPARLAQAGLGNVATRQALPLERLAPWDEAREGLVFFDLRDVRVERHFALVPHGELYREVDLYRGLLSFDVETSEGPRTVRVGLRSLSFARRGL